MAQRPLTHSEMAAKLVVEGSLDKIAGKAKDKFPIEGVRLNDDQRRRFGREPGGSTIFYPIDPNGVYIDFHGAATTVWFTDADSSEALKLFEKALKKSYPKAKQREDKPHPTDQWTRQRSYDVPLGGDRAAVVDVAYPAPEALPKGFLVRILAYGRSDKKKKN
jgi:hypothetical protein